MKRVFSVPPPESEPVAGYETRMPYQDPDTMPPVAQPFVPAMYRHVTQAHRKAIERIFTRIRKHNEGPQAREESRGE